MQQERKRVVIWGFGRLGREIARIIGENRSLGLSVVAVVDNAPTLAGRKAAEMVPTLPQSIVVQPQLTTGADVVFHCTESGADAVRQQVLSAIETGSDVITAAEWMFNPWLLHAESAKQIDAAARKAGRRVLGCGINPGFSFDAMPLVLSRTLTGIRSIEIIRIADSSTSGMSDRQHVGFGLPYETFMSRLKANSVKGHIGFPESIAAISERLGLEVDRITERWEPVRAVRPLKLPHVSLEIGDVVAVKQEAIAYRGDDVRLRMVLEMHLDAAGYGARLREEVTVEADTKTTLVITPAARSSTGGAGVMTGAAVDISDAKPGLVSFLDLAMGGRMRSPGRLQLKHRTAQDAGAELTLQMTAG